MTDITTVRALRGALRPHSDAPLRLLVGGAGHAAFHVTEVRHQAVDALDCGGGGHARAEAVAQVLLGGAEGMRARTLDGILARTVSRDPRVEAAALSLEVGPPGLSRFVVAGVVPGPDGLTLRLEPMEAACAPARQRAAACEPACCA